MPGRCCQSPVRRLARELAAAGGKPVRRIKRQSGIGQSGLHATTTHRTMKPSGASPTFKKAPKLRWRKTAHATQSLAGFQVIINGRFWMITEDLVAC
jgi:hypothetical protein